MDGRIACIDYAATPESELFSQAFLNAAEHTRLYRINHPGQRKAFLAGRVLIRGLATIEIGLNAAEITIDTDTHGKPFLPSAPNWYFNLSHSRGLCVLASARQSIGIDVELLRDSSNYRDLAHTLFEIEKPQLPVKALPEDIMHSQLYDSDLAFYVAWTRQEACLKWQGSGLAGFSAVPNLQHCLSAEIRLDSGLRRYIVSLYQNHRKDCCLVLDEHFTSSGASLITLKF